MSALNDYLEGKVQKSRILRDDAIDELAQLRADLQAAQERIAEQARQLAEAREVIARCSVYIESIDHGENTKTYMMCDAWLAANPAPSVDDQAAADRFNDWHKEREEDFSRRIEAAS